MIGWERMTPHLIGARGVPTRAVRGKVAQYSSDSFIESPLWRVPFVDLQVDYREHGC
jgi:hypothetical protein